MARYTWFLTVSVASLIICVGSGMSFGASQASANYAIEKTVVDGGGGGGSSASYALSHVLGQSSPVVFSSSDQYTVYGGFRHPTQVPQVSAISVSPASHSFGGVEVGQEARETLTIENNGTGDLVLGNLAIAGAQASQFTIQNDACSGQTVIPSAAGTVDVVFSPQSEGVMNANLRIPSNDPDTPLLEVPLSGSGTSIPGSPPSDGGGDGCFIDTAAPGFRR
jgi:hypothetical protein